MKINNLDKIIEDYLIRNENKLKINSNDILSGDVFIALQGRNVHGNKYINDALDNGAKYVITDKNADSFINENNILLINDALLFLLTIANKKRNNFRGKVIGITGSVGKTSVKENLKFLLSFESKVSASIKSYNNYLGVLISLINMDNFSDFAIFEIGTNNFHEIGKLTSIIMPQQVIITNIFPTHLESFKSTMNIAIEKSDIFNLKYNPEIELLILPNSNSDELFLYDQSKKMKISKILTVGKKPNSNYYIQEINKTNKKNIIIKVNNKESYKINFNTDYYHQIYNAIICLAIFEHNNLPLKTFHKKVKSIPRIEGRGLMNEIVIDDKKILFIDESYNASPVTMKICIDYFYELELQVTQKKYIILGEMNELGNLSKMYHQNIIKQILYYKFENVILCGNLFKSLLNKMKIKTDQINCILDENEIMQFLKKNIHNNDIILIKGSNSTKVNKLANMLNANKE
jgi:murE/murF fusion protein